ncbi:class I SAM-dependent methyltransferase [Gimesia aquarii]|uniref:Tellurite resistance protein TehB n=1 Tax=Gimesia aquarii TaxID=2527964 RepID=A0A517VRE1_9PLAN|nr:class I SAM-dependent methyltransferase [Gimesia aquarii]QDT95572.1 tellurite resistance protein TehB [Gimesia aquarii]
MWDEKFDTKHYVYGTEPNDFLKVQFGIIPIGKVLCLAEGEGRNAVFLAQQGYHVTAVDASIVGLEKAKRLADENNVCIEFIHADLENYDPGENQWDGIVSIFCHIPDPIRKKLHQKVVKGLKSNGVLLLEAYTPDQLKHKTGGPPTEEMMMSKALLEKELAGLKFRHLLELEREVIEGTNHFGIGAVVQAIGTRQ